MVEQAFRDRWWRSDRTITLDHQGNPVVGPESTPRNTDEYTMMEANFSLFWGVAIQLYEATLVSDDTPFDRFLDRRGTISAAARRGMDVFEDDGECGECHNGALLGANQFINIGVRPVSEDPGAGGGRFRIPQLRNIAITNPYFHNGGQLTLRQVVDFYDRGGDFRNDELDELELSSRQKNDLVSFMLTLTDERVSCRRAPFDGPSLKLSNGRNIRATGAEGLTEEDCLEPMLNRRGNGNFHFQP